MSFQRTKRHLRKALSRTRETSLFARIREYHKLAGSSFDQPPANGFNHFVVSRYFRSKARQPQGWSPTCHVV